MTTRLFAGPVLQPGQGRLDGEHYLPSTAESIRWGWLANRDSTPVMRLASGSTVTIDAVSHEGLMEDQGRDPVGYMGSLGVAKSMVLQDAIDIAANAEHDYDRDGPHVVTGPIEVIGAEPGDLLRIEMLSITRRVPYGFISARHGLGALPGELPRGERLPGASVAKPELYGSVCSFTTVDESGDRELGVLPYGAGLSAKFPLNPFMGLVGVAKDTSEPVNSIPPGDHGGNLDIKLLGSGSTLYLPVQVPGAMFYVGDPHFAQGNGEVALTAFEGSLRVTYRLSVVDRDSADACIGLLRHPFAENREEWIAVGLHADLNEAMREATRSAVSFLTSAVGMTPEEAMAYLSAAADFAVSQVVDDVKGVHCTIRKTDFPGYEAPRVVIR